MTPGVYMALAALAGDHLHQPVPHPVEIDEGCELVASAAVYIAINRFGTVEYVGSVDRSGHPIGLHRRIREHLRLPGRSGRWVRLWVLPLKPGTPRSVVRELEGEVGRLLCPTGGRRLPRRRHSP